MRYEDSLAQLKEILSKEFMNTYGLDHVDKEYP